MSSNSGRRPQLATQLAQLTHADLRHLLAYIATRRRIYLYWTYNGWTIIP